jgi:hypothetical protein
LGSTSFPAGRTTFSGGGGASEDVTRISAGFCGTSKALLTSVAPPTNPAPMSKTDVATPAKKTCVVDAMATLQCCVTNAEDPASFDLQERGQGEQTSGIEVCRLVTNRSTN